MLRLNLMAAATVPAGLWQDAADELESLKSKKLYRELKVSSQSLLDFSSNDYLGLTQNRRVRQSAIEAVKRFGTGSGASRLISGNLKIHEDLEKKLARFKHEASALVFSSGYLANLGAVKSLVDERDVVILDRLNHASLVDAARLSKAKLWVYPHKNVDALRDLLSRAKTFRRRLVVTDAYFSMDGDVAPLGRLHELCAETDSILMIDEAHSTGVFGKTGRGLTEHFGLEGKVPVVMGTLSKALGSVGGFIAGGSVLRESLINRARTFIYTTAPAPAASGAALASLDWIEKNPKSIAAFWGIIERVREGLLEEGFDLMGSEGPIIPIRVGDTAKALKAREFLAREGLFVPAVRPPTVPKNTDRLRVSLKATHTRGQIDRLLASLKKAKGRVL